MDFLVLGGVVIFAACVGAAAGYVARHQRAQAQEAEQETLIAKLEQMLKTSGERQAHMRDQIMGLDKTVEELRRAQSQLEAEKRRREMVDRAMQQSPFESAPSARDDDDKKGPPSSFADTQVMDN